MAKRTEPDTDTALLDPEVQPEAKAEPKAKGEPPLTRQAARDHFINRCLHDWGRDQFLADRACRPEAGHVAKLVEKAGKLFDLLFETRPITPNLR